MLNRISCHLFDTKQKRAVPERRTIESKQISTISSLIDISKVNELYAERQHENYGGLYALKCNRNALKTRNLNISSATLQNCDINHEKFQPCQTKTSLELNTLALSTDESTIYSTDFTEVELNNETINEEIQFKQKSLIKSASQYPAECLNRGISMHIKPV